MFWQSSQKNDTFPNVNRKRAFYDVHCHLMNLSHPAFVSIIESMRHRPREVIYSQIASYDYLATSLLRRGGEKLRNLLAVMDNDCADILYLIEDDLAGNFRAPHHGSQSHLLPPLREGLLHVAHQEFSEIVLTPLIMDFSTPDSLRPDTYYNLPPRKPIEAQIIDVMNAIRTYREIRPRGALRIFPFLGVNTKNYTLENLASFLDTWFSNYIPDEEILEQKFLSLLSLGSETRVQDFGLAAGIKLYPPLGFDPWPDSVEEREKVEFLYSYAESRRIPITTHCDDQGYRIIPLEESLLFTAPSRYQSVLEHHPNLVLNFAHMGKRHIRSIRGKIQKDWQKDIFGLIREYPHVYTDFSFIGGDPEFYKGLISEMKSNSESDAKRIARRILFGSDFIVNLLKVRSYRDYIELFSQSELSDELKVLFCSKNPQEFLFGRIAALQKHSR